MRWLVHECKALRGVPGAWADCCTRSAVLHSHHTYQSRSRFVPTGRPAPRRRGAWPGATPSVMAAGVLGGLHVLLVLLAGLVQLPTALAQTLAPTTMWFQGAYPRVDFQFAWISAGTGYGTETNSITLAPAPTPQTTNVWFSQVRE